VQTVEPAVEPAFDARSEGEALWRLGQLLGLAGFSTSYEARAGA
jgi:hypothetical protein